MKDAKKSLEFYTSVMGMQLVAERHYGPGKGDFSLYFLCNKNDVGPDVPKDPTDPEVRISKCCSLVRKTNLKTLLASLQSFFRNRLCFTSRMCFIHRA